MERAIMCPQCNAPLAPHRFARSVVCSYCGATVRLDESTVSAELFRKAYQAWNAPQSHQFSSWLSLRESHWALADCLANGDISDVYAGQRARWPTELVLIKLLRDNKDIALFDNEWEMLQILQRSEAPGADIFTSFLPQPVSHGNITEGPYTGKRVNIYRWASGFHHTFEEVLNTYPHGIPARASIWIWRRILEILSFIHNSGLVHGAILPSHLLVQENEHGVRLVGYSAAGRSGETLQTISHRFESFYPQSTRSRLSLTAQLDITMSARCMIAILGGNPENGTLPGAVPSRLAGLLQRIARNGPSHSTREDAWSIREELGVIAGEVFGSPQFFPIVMPT
jgi:hypothetical protein